MIREKQRGKVVVVGAKCDIYSGFRMCNETYHPRNTELTSNSRRSDSADVQALVCESMEIHLPRSRISTS